MRVYVSLFIYQCHSVYDSFALTTDLNAADYSTTWKKTTHDTHLGEMYPLSSYSLFNCPMTGVNRSVTCRHRVRVSTFAWELKTRTLLCHERSDDNVSFYFLLLEGIPRPWRRQVLQHSQNRRSSQQEGFKANPKT